MAKISLFELLRRDGQIDMPVGPDIGGFLRIKANNRLIAKRAQLACDIGLFSDEADQLDLVEMFQDQPEDGL